MATPSSPTSRSTSPLRERLVDAAESLFYEDGIRATGVEAVAQKAHAAKISLYRTFDTKDDLVLAYLDRRRAAYWLQWDKLVSLHGTPRDQLLAFIDYLCDRATTPGYRGCPFMNGAIEFPDPHSPEHRSAVSMKNDVRDRLRLLCLPVAEDGDGLADALFLLIEGTYATAHTLGGADGPIRVLPRTARLLIDAMEDAEGSPPTPRR